MADTPKIQIDSDWKAQAQAEKQKLAEKTAPGKTSAAAKPSSPRQMPPASFETLVSMLATQALLFMGAIPDPRSGQRIQSLDLARHHIDLLTMLEDKTKGNLTDSEQQLLSGTLFELRQRYVQLTVAMRGV